jgi:putative transposase
MAQGWHLGGDPHGSSRAGAPSRRLRAHTQCSDSRQPKREDHGTGHPLGGGPAGEHTIGFDGFKKIKGRKRHLLVDTQGLALKVKVTAANLREQAGARQLLTDLVGQFPRMQLVWADQGYTADLNDWMQEKLGWRLEIVKRSTEQEHHEKIRAIAKERQEAGASVVEMWAGLPYGRGIEVLPRRWVVERTFAWLGKYRRLSKDYEFLPESSEVMIYLAMIRLMLKRLDKMAQKGAT